MKSSQYLKKQYRKKFIKELLKKPKDERQKFWEFICLHIFNVSEENYELRKENKILREKVKSKKSWFA